MHLWFIQHSIEQLVSAIWGTNNPQLFINGITNRNRERMRKGVGRVWEGGHRLNMELDLQSLFGLLCTAVLIGWDPAASPPPSPHLGSYTRALLVSQDWWHLFVTPWGGSGIHSIRSIEGPNGGNAASWKFFQISSQWESQKNRSALISFGKIHIWPPCIWNHLLMSYRLWKRWELILCLIINIFWIVGNPMPELTLTSLHSWL